MQRAIDIRGLSKGQVPEHDVRGRYDDRRGRPGHGFSKERYSSQNRIASLALLLADAPGRRDQVIFLDTNRGSNPGRDRALDPRHARIRLS
jgi:hypothetical protein